MYSSASLCWYLFGIQVNKVIYLRLAINVVKLLYFLAYQVVARHTLLKKVTGTKPEEDLSYNNILTFLIVSTSLIVFASAMEILVYFVYNNKVSRFYLHLIISIKVFILFVVSSKKGDSGGLRKEGC